MKPCSNSVNKKKLLLMPGYAKHQQLFNSRKLQNKARIEYPLRLCEYVAKDNRQRIKESKKNFPWRFFRGDFHSHSNHSDGIGTVTETAQMMKSAGLDFQFVTDHWGVTQAPECRKHKLWFGQEPSTQYHHLGILGLEYAFIPTGNFLKDFERARQLGATVFIPHPTGWWPDVVYDAKQTEILEKLHFPFLMEICNGANNIISAFDYTDRSAIKLWDNLLMRGHIVHAIGNTDAHAPHCIGMIWNGVFSNNNSQNFILKAVNKGNSFISDGPLLYICIDHTEMGGCTKKTNKPKKLEITAVDSRGLSRVSVIADGTQICDKRIDNKTICKFSYTLPKKLARYVRVEILSQDGKFAFSNPIYFS